MQKYIDYYEVLEVRENASNEVIKMAYKALALKYLVECLRVVDID